MSITLNFFSTDYYNEGIIHHPILHIIMQRTYFHCYGRSNKFIIYPQRIKLTIFFNLMWNQNSNSDFSRVVLRMKLAIYVGT